MASGAALRLIRIGQTAPAFEIAEMILSDPRALSTRLPAGCPLKQASEICLL
jgi:hypothetical protein